MKLTLNVWRQKNASDKGQFVRYTMDQVNPDMSFLEMLDVLNNDLERKHQDPIAFEHDCREGICGACSMMINGMPHGGQNKTTTCQLHMRRFKNNSTLTIEPFRATAFPVIKDLIVDRSAFERIQQSGGYISVNTGSAPDANAIPIGKEKSDLAFDAAACIGCGACVAACKNASASLFVAARIAHMGALPQGQVEQTKRAIQMIHAMDQEGFGHCTNEAECEAACPKRISTHHITRMNRTFLKASLFPKP